MSDADKPLLVFDFDGTIANTLETGLQIYNEVAEDYALDQITMDEAKELRKLNTRALLDHLGISRILAVRIGAHLRRLLHNRMDEVGIMPGVGEAVRRLSDDGYPMGVLSSNSGDNIRSFLDRFGLRDCFKFVEAGVSLFGKPKRIRKLLRKRKLEPARVAYIGDETRDMEAARIAEVRSVAVCWGANGREAMMTEGPDFCLDSPDELRSCAQALREGRLPTA